MMSPRTWRSVPANFCTRRLGRRGVTIDPPATHRHDDRRGQSPHLGVVVQMSAPSSMIAVLNFAASTPPSASGSRDSITASSRFDGDRGSYSPW